MKIIDLSVPLNEKTPVYPGDPQTSIKPAGILEKDGYNDSVITFGNHNGTHIDAPIHMVEGGKSLGDISVDHFVGRGIYIKVDDKKFDIDKVKSTNIQEGDIVLFWTGMSSKYHETEYFEKYPAMPKEIAQYLVDKKIKMVGLDCASPDYEPFEEHKILLGGNVLIAENLTNLDKLEGLDFEVIALPINLQGDGAPARVIARVL